VNNNEIMRALLQTSLAASEASAAECLAYYRLLHTHGQARKMALVEYRCAGKGCLLARIVGSPAGLFLVTFGHHYSPEAAQRHTASGNVDWPTRARLLGGPDEAVQLTCDHLQTGYAGKSLHADYAQATQTGKRVLRSIRGGGGA